jgi:hypothetical protein
MVRFELFAGVVVLGLWVYSLIGVITSKDGEIRNLPKLWWLVIVLLFPLAGSIAWLVAGQPQGSAGRSKCEREAPGFPEYDRPGRASATSSQDDEEFLRRVRERAEEQRRAYRAAQLEEQKKQHRLEQERQERKQQGDPETGS